MVNRIETQVYRFLLDVVHFGYSVRYIYAIALVHARPAKLLTEALNWGLIDRATFDTWYNEIVGQ